MKRLSATIGLLLLGALLVLTGCVNQPVANVTPQQYLVKRGDTLSSIAWRFQLDYRTLAYWNRIDAPYTIHPGQRLFLNPPPSQGTPPLASSAREPSLQVPRAAVPNPYRGYPSQPTVEPPEPVLRWGWPTRGRVVRQFSTQGNGGVDIRGVEGQAVVAAAPGSVVYSGTGLKGYGELIIIRHSQTYLSAYAHNRVRFVKEGDAVASGQKIAELGKNNKGDPILHFEIRKYGKPVDPMVFLPAAAQQNQL